MKVTRHQHATFSGGGMGAALADALTIGPVILSAGTTRLVPPSCEIEVSEADMAAVLAVVQITDGGKIEAGPATLSVGAFVGDQKQGAVWAVLDQARNARRRHALIEAGATDVSPSGRCGTFDGHTLGKTNDGWIWFYSGGPFYPTIALALCSKPKP